MELSELRAGDADSRARRRVSRLLGALLLVIGLVASGPGLAHSFDPGPAPPPPLPSPPPTDPPSPPGGPGPVPSPPPSGGTQEQTFQDGTRVCRAIAGPRYIGAVCTDSSGGDAIEVVIENILDGHPLPDCWHEPLTDAELRSLGLRNDEDGSAWYWVKCLHGVDPDTFEVDDDGAYVSLYYRRLGEEDIVELTERQRELIDFLSTDKMIPAPILGVSPSAVPVVNQDLSFYNAGAELGEHELHITVGEMGVQMRARVSGLTVDSGTGDQVTCADNGYRAKHGETRDDYPQGCWYAYGDTSLGLDQDAFGSEVTARWVVEINRGYGWQYFHEFDKAAHHLVQVNEIQAVVVP